MRNALFLVLIGLGAIPTFGCDLCGCSANGNYLNVVPGGQKTYFGVAHYYRAFTSTHPILFAGETPAVSREYFHTTELSGRVQIHPKVQLFAFIPIHSNTIVEGNNTYTNMGLGDIRLNAVVPVFKSNWASTPKWRYLVLSGLGLKAPTGNNSFHPEAMNVFLPNLQLGSGSWDGVAYVNVSARKKQWISNLDLSIAYNGTNQKQYQFGRRLSSRISTGFWIPSFFLKGAVVPQLGTQLDHAQEDLHRARVNPFSGGHQWYGFASIQVYSGKWMLGLRYFEVVDQQFAQGLVQNNFKGEVSLTYFPILKNNSKRKTT